MVWPEGSAAGADPGDHVPGAIAATSTTAAITSIAATAITATGTAFISTSASRW
ncbi:hypothetical protein [Duganella phyllosphaerae]|uniref:hypothetical protein n=1 Tax=Duganella phyllosphaerae TaxID=762836 RepID=UPI001428C0E5|nr:hypothetical protein [Duganella phyllosphaerae]